MKKLIYICIYIVLIIYTIIALFPLYWLVTTSFKLPLEVFSTAPLGFFKMKIINYQTIFFKDTYPKFLVNSVIISFLTVAVTIPLGCLAGYAFARLPIGRKDTWFFTVLTTRMAPPVAFAVPIYIMMVRFRLIDSYFGIIAIYVFMNIAFCIWLARGFFEEIPPEYEEAAMLDGCSRLGALIKIIIPLSKTGLIATAVLIFIFTWNEYFFASIITQNIAKTFTVHLTSYFGSRRILWGELAATSTIGSLIPIIFAILMRRYMIRGLTFGTIKEE